MDRQTRHRKAKDSKTPTKQPRKRTTTQDKAKTSVNVNQINLTLNNNNINIKNTNIIMPAYDQKLKISIVKGNGKDYSPKQKLANHLTRLLSGYDPCCSVCLDGKTIYIATNHIYQKEDTNKDEPTYQYQLIENIMNALKSRKIDLAKPDTYQIFVDSLYHNLRTRHPGFFIKVDKELAMDYLSWFFKGKDAKEFSSLIHQPFNSEEIQDIINKFINALVYVLKDNFIKNDFNYHIVKEDKNGVHCELRVIQYLLKKYNNYKGKEEKEFYIATNLRPCSDCDFILRTLTKTTNDNLRFKIRRASTESYTKYVVPKIINLSKADYKTTKNMLDGKPVAKVPLDSDTPKKPAFKKLTKDDVSSFKIDKKIISPMGKLYLSHSKHNNFKEIDEFTDEIIKGNNRLELKALKSCLERNYKKFESNSHK
jgi:hypothetical protein